MDQENGLASPLQSSTIPSTMAELDEMERQLILEREVNERRNTDIDQKLDSIKRAKEALSQFIDPNPSELSGALSAVSSMEGEAFKTWDEFRDAGYDVPVVCPATPSELRQIIKERPIPVGMKTKLAWAVKRDRNLAALKMMAMRESDQKFRLLDFANAMAATGFFEGSGYRFKTTLRRHMASCPDEWEDLQQGLWQYRGSP